jgi:hypothetical protein
VDDETCQLVVAVMTEESLEGTLEKCQDANTSLFQQAKVAGKEKRNMIANQKLLALLCVGNLPLELINLFKFRDFCASLNAEVKIDSASQFQHKWIPYAAVGGILYNGYKTTLTLRKICRQVCKSYWITRSL